jgi:hypothetical protein
MMATLTGVLAGQTNDWGRIQRLAVGTPLIIKTDKVSRIECRLKSANDSSLIVQAAKGEQTLDRGTIKRIYLGIHKKKNGAKLATGAVIVAGLLGFGILDAAIRGPTDYPSVLPIFAAFGVGALVQKQLTKGFKRGDLIYEVH